MQEMPQKQKFVADFLLPRKALPCMLDCLYGTFARVCVCGPQATNDGTLYLTNFYTKPLGLFVHANSAGQRERE